MNLLQCFIFIPIFVFLEVYNDDFFESLDGIANALDNVDASKLTKDQYSFNKRI